MILGYTSLELIRIVFGTLFFLFLIAIGIQELKVNLGNLLSWVIETFVELIQRLRGKHVTNHSQRYFAIWLEGFREELRYAAIFAFFTTLCSWGLIILAYYIAMFWARE